MTRSREITPFVLRLADGSAYPLRFGWPRDRVIEYNLRVSQAAESDVAQLFGDAQRLHTPVELDHYVYGDSRIHAARLVAEVDAALAQAVALTFADLTFPLLRAYRFAKVPSDDEGPGFRLTTRFLGSQHEFSDSDGHAVPLI